MTDTTDTTPAMVTPDAPKPAPKDDSKGAPVAPTVKPREIGGPAGPEPTRYGDWEQKGRCTDF